MGDQEIHRAARPRADLGSARITSSAHLLALATAALLTGCASLPYNVPIRVPVDGRRGFSMQGSLKFTGDPAVTKQRIQKAFDQACGAPAIIVQYDLRQKDSSVGLKFYNYEAVAKCPN